jgi:hypothetical protein
MAVSPNRVACVTIGGKKRGRAVNAHKSVLSLPAPSRIRDRDHVRLAAKQRCLVCSRPPADTHHLRFAQQRALGRNVSDEFMVIIARFTAGDEAAW